MLIKISTLTEKSDYVFKVNDQNNINNRIKVASHYNAYCLGIMQQKTQTSNRKYVKMTRKKKTMKKQ